METMRLHEDWSIAGTKLSDFSQAIELLDTHTKVISVPTNKIQILSFTKIENEVMYMTKCFAPNCSQNVKISLSTLKEKGFTDEDIAEMSTGSRYMLFINNKLLFASPSLIATLGQRAKLSGYGMLDDSVLRDMFIIEKMNANSEIANIVFRTNDNDGKKAFACLGKQYSYIKQDILIDIIKNMTSLGEAKCDYWTITHNFTRIYLSFPDCAAEIKKIYNLPDDFIPGIYLCTSDTGDSSIVCKGTWRIGNSLIATNSYAKKHTPKTTVEDILDNINNRIFDKYTTMPMKLAELMEIEVVNPILTIKDALKFFGIEKIIGVKKTEELIESINSELSSVPYTAYDIAMLLMTIANRCTELTSRQKIDMETILGKAPYYPFSGKRLSLVA